MHIQFDEQSSPELSPTSQKVTDSQHPIKTEISDPKIPGEYVAIIGIKRDVSEDEDLENVTVGGYAVVWKNDMFPIQSGSYAGEANVNLFMELAATKVILEISPPDKPLSICAKDYQLVTMINSNKIPLKRRKRTIGPLMEEVRALLQKRTVKCQALRMGGVNGPGGVQEMRNYALEIATKAQQARMKLRPVQLEVILSASTSTQETKEQPKQNALDALPDAPQQPQQPELAHENDLKPAVAPPVENGSTNEPNRGNEESQVTEITTKKEDIVMTHVEENGEDTTKSNGRKRSRTVDEDVEMEERTTEEESITHKKVKMTEEPLSRNIKDCVDTQQQQNGDTNQTGWLSWMKNMFGLNK